MKAMLRRAVALAVLAGAFAATPAQFGKNKINYETFDWRVYHSPHFDVYHYASTEPFLEEIVSYAESAYVEISTKLDHELRWRVPMIVYKTHGEFEQTNVALQEIPEFVAAFSEPAQNRMVLPIDLPPDKLYELVAHELTHIFQYSMFFEGYLGRAIRSDPPAWLIEGMASYLAQDEDNLDRMAIRDAVVNNILPPIQALTVVTFLTYRYGHAVFDYIEQEHGEEGVRTFLFEFRKNLLAGDVGKAIKDAFGYDIDEFNRRFNRFLRQRYFPVLLEKKSPDDYGTEIGLKKRPGTYTFSPTISPSGELVAALSTPKQELDLVVLSADDGKLIRNLTKGWTNDYIHLVAAAFEGKRDLSWSPAGDQVAVFARRENRWPLLIFDALSGERLRNIPLREHEIVECASPAFSPDGRRVAFEGNREGVVDIFELELESGQVRNLTQDQFFDANPWYAADGKTLLYNRRIGEYWKIFAVDVGDAARKTQLTFGPSSDIQPSYSTDAGTVFFSSDRSEYGVFNIHSLDLSTGDIAQHTDLTGGAFAPTELAEREGKRYLAFAAYFEGTFRLYRMPLEEPEGTSALEEPLEESIEAEPFEPPLNLTIDEQAKEDYKLKWDLEAPGFTVGVADDGTLLSAAAIEFSDLLGDHRVRVQAYSVEDFASYQASYFNLKHRFNWGAGAYDSRDFFLAQGAAGNLTVAERRTTGAQAFYQYPLSRHYRFDAAVGAQDFSQDEFDLDASFAAGVPVFRSFDATFGTAQLDFVGDTTRFQSWGPFQGKRFNIGVLYAPELSGDAAGDINEYRLDFRAYKQATRRSLLAFRAATLLNEGEEQYLYGFGGVNQLRGWDFREFVGNNLAWANVEFRFPLVDRLRFPVFELTQIRGFFFADAGAAWLDDDRWYDPELRVSGSPFRGGVRIDPDGTPIEFDFWDGDNDRPQDLRITYGTGFQLFFLGLQLNWVWSQRMDYTRFCSPSDLTECVFDPASAAPLEKRKIDGGGTRTDFYISYDW